MTHLYPYLAQLSAAGGPGGGGGGGEGAAPSLFGSPIFLIILIVVMFYFVLYRPEKRRKQERENMLKNLQRGDEVVTAGGIYGKITALTDTTVTVEVANNTRLKVGRQFISSVVNRDKQAQAEKPDKPEKAEKADKEPEESKRKKLGGKKGK
ncbi:MAG: preprotein translocase subunit YajC [bacterium]